MIETFVMKELKYTADKIVYSDSVFITLSDLKVVFHKFYMVHS